MTHDTPESTATEPRPSLSGITIVQPARSEEHVVRAALPDTPREELTGAMTGCVVHLCGCGAS